MRTLIHCVTGSPPGTDGHCIKSPSSRLCAGMVQASLNRRLEVHPFATFPADEGIDHANAMESVHHCAMRTLGATDFHRRQFHQPRAGLVDGNRIDYRAARVAFEIGHTAVFLDDKAAVTVRAGGDFMRDDQILAFVFALRHLGRRLRLIRPFSFAPGGSPATHAQDRTFAAYGLPARKRHCITVRPTRRRPLMRFI